MCRASKKIKPLLYVPISRMPVWCFAVLYGGPLVTIFRARSHTGVMDYDEACFMQLTPRVVHNFPKAVGV